MILYIYIYIYIYIYKPYICMYNAYICVCYYTSIIRSEAAICSSTLISPSVNDYNISILYIIYKYTHIYTHTCLRTYCTYIGLDTFRFIHTCRHIHIHTRRPCCVSVLQHRLRSMGHCNLSHSPHVDNEPRRSAVI